MNKHEEIRMQLNAINDAPIMKYTHQCEFAEKDYEKRLDLLAGKCTELSLKLEQTEKDFLQLKSYLHQFRKRWREVKNQQELNEVCGFFINEVFKSFLRRV
jgi:hypothetical protein